MEEQESTDVRAHNRAAWDRNVEQGNRWTIPVSAEIVEKARQGRLELLLTPTKPVPPRWYPPFNGRRYYAWHPVEDSRDRYSPPQELE